MWAGRNSSTAALSLALGHCSRVAQAGLWPRPMAKRRPLTIEGELVAKSTGADSRFGVGDRVFDQEFDSGNVTAVDA
jgi:hypothetical protein